MVWHHSKALVSLGFGLLFLLMGCSSETGPHDDPTATVYEPTAPHSQQVGAQLLGPRVYTIDARSRDIWVYFDFARNAVVAIQHPKTESWDLAFQRHLIRTNGGQTNPAAQGALLRLQERALAAVVKVPDKADFVSDVHPKNRPSSYNPLIEKWFDYSYLANVLAPKALVYIVRTHDSKYAKIRILSYYCAQKSAGCLTFEYVYQGDGSTNLASPSA